MTANEIRTTAREATVALLEDVLTANEAVQFADASYAIRQEVDGVEVWTEITVKTKAYKATKVNPAFDPFEAAEVWKIERAEKEADRLAKEAEKARKKKAKTEGEE